MPDQADVLSYFVAQLDLIQCSLVEHSLVYSKILTGGSDRFIVCLNWCKFIFTGGHPKYR